MVQTAHEHEARIEETLSKPDVTLLSFPEVRGEGSREVREQVLQRKKEALEDTPAVEHVDYNYLRKSAYTPNDPNYVNGRLWGLKKIGVSRAWDSTRGRGIKIAVVDTGIAASHPDIESKIIAQTDTVNNDSTAEDDDFGHGTHVAGTLGASTNNARGVAGGCFRCGLLVAKAGNYSEGFYDSDVIEGIYWSVQNEAKAINLSLGGPGHSWAMERAVNYAWERGVVVVAAAGNQNSSTPNYPSGYANVMSVAATNKKDQRAPFSNYGKVDVSAPGVGIISTVPGGGYEAYSGTSMASPHVAALAGLLAAQGRSAVEIRERMQATTRDLGPVGKDTYYGWGRIDAGEAVRP